MGIPRTDRPMTAMTPHDICYVERALTVLGGKWTILLVHELMEGPKRFGELRRAIPEASAKMLTMRLRELETAKLLDRRSFSEVPPHVEYRLTQKGLELHDAIEELRKWGTQYYTD